MASRAHGRAARRSRATAAPGVEPAALVCALCALLGAALIVVASFAGPASAATNPSAEQIHAKLDAAAVARDIPPKILYAIAFQESSWRQFDAAGRPLMSADGGIGIMQVTSYGDYDVARLKTDIDYNIAAGADILLEKWGYAPSVIPVIGDGLMSCYEDWFYAVWAYNGWVAYNQYPYKVWGLIAAGPAGLWTGVPVTAVPASTLVDGFGVEVPTPQPAHYWSPVPLPKPQLGAPVAPARVRAGVRFTVAGTLSPQHAAGAQSVQLRCYRRTGSTWVLRRTVPAANADAGTATTYTAKLALGQAGAWRIRAYAPADAEHAAALSAAASVTVR
jgi:hypothetical protein